MHYGALTWGSAAISQINQISKDVRKAIRVLNFKSYSESSFPLFQESSILPVEENNLLYNAIFIWKYSNNLLPNVIENIFVQNDTSQLLSTQVITIDYMYLFVELIKLKDQ